MSVEAALAPAVQDGWCPHLAMLLRAPEDVPPALSSFFALGAKRDGWLLHRSLPGRVAADREALAAEGLPVGDLEAGGRFEIAELDLRVPPERWAQPFLPLLDAALARGFRAGWWARFPIGPADFARALAYDEAWGAACAGRPIVSLCLYIVRDVEREERAARLAPLHDGLLVATEDGVTLRR